MIIATTFGRMARSCTRLLPRWIRGQRQEASERMAFSSGSALEVLCRVVQDPR